jgi:hypothetical protein
MAERRYHEANAGRDSRPVIWFFEGNNILWMVFGMGVALLAFRFCHGKLNWSTGEAIIAALVPLIAVSAYVILLKSGKPKSFDREFFEWLVHRSRVWLAEAGWARHRAYFAPTRGKRPGHPLKPEPLEEGGAPQSNQPTGKRA